MLKDGGMESFSMSSGQILYLTGRNPQLIRLRVKKLSQHKKNVSLVQYEFSLRCYVLLELYFKWDIFHS